MCVRPRSWRGVLDTTLCDKVCQWFSPGTSVSSTNKTDRHDITEILLKGGIKHHKPSHLKLNDNCIIDHLHVVSFFVICLFIQEQIYTYMIL
jgi:hypothetical protein